MSAHVVVEPRSASSETAGVWATVALAWGLVGLVGLVWLAGRSASVLAGQGWSGPEFGFEFAETLIRGRGPAVAWPTVAPALVWAMTGGYLAAVVAAAGAVGWRVRRWRTARAPEVERCEFPAGVDRLGPVTLPALRRSAGRMRPSLAGHRPGRLPAAVVGTPLGRHRPSGVELRSSFEDVALVIMAPRAGKTAGYAVPAIIEAPGPVVVTSAKGDVWAATAAIRGEVGEVVVFDPMGVTPVPQGVWWNPLADVATYADAYRLAGHFMAEVRGGAGNELFVQAARDLLASLFLAAAADGRTVTAVTEWLHSPGSAVPGRLLRTHGHDSVGRSLDARRAGAEVTVQGIWEVARTAAACLQRHDVQAWVAPELPPGPAFDPRAFLESPRGTVYLLSRADVGGGAQPIIAALTDRLLLTADELAVEAGGRLDPPVTVVLDEAANICKIPDLPALYSTAGSKGICISTILQSRPQGRGVWGTDGFEALWSAATIKLIWAGVDDPHLLSDLEQLIGVHDVESRTIALDGRGGTATLAPRPVLPAAAIRSMPKGHALLFATGCPVATIALQMAHDGPHARRVAAAHATAAATHQTARRAPNEPRTARPTDTTDVASAEDGPGPIGEVA